MFKTSGKKGSLQFLAHLKAGNQSHSVDLFVFSKEWVTPPPSLGRGAEHSSRGLINPPEMGGGQTGAV